jgi:hypothetical protein
MLDERKMAMDNGRRKHRVSLDRAFPSWDSELEKEEVAREEGHSQEIGAFLEWMKWNQEEHIHAGASINTLLEEYFEIDHKAVENQRRMLIKYVQWMNKQDKSS